MSTALATQPPPLDPAIVANVLLTGDLEKLNDQQRMAYCTRVCESLGLNPLTQPFAFIKLNGKLRMYALKDATEQLRKLHSVSITEVTSQRVEDVFVVTAKAQDRTGRTDAATGAVSVGSLKGEALANALMKAETKAKRRVTLSICGLGMLDELEVETVHREPPYTVEAPKRVELPEGTVQIINVVPKSKGAAQWAEVTYVTATGEEQVLPTPADGTGAAVGLLEALAQEAVPVYITTKVTPRSKKTVIAAAKRWQSAEAEAAIREAELAHEVERQADEPPPITADQIPF
jgi:hypothetical protein